MKFILISLILCMSLSGSASSPVSLTSDVVMMESRLKQALKSSTRLVVKLRKSTRKGYEISTLLETTNLADIESFVEGLALKDNGLGPFVTCNGKIIVELYDEGNLTNSINFVNSDTLKWEKGSQWDGDARLSEKSEEYMANWFLERNIDEQAKELIKSKKARKRFEEKLDRAFKGLPKLLKSNYSDSGKFEEILKREFLSPEEQLETLFFIFGAEENWRMSGNLDISVDKLIRSYNLAQLQKAVRSALLSEDEIKKQGATRFWESYPPPLEGWVPHDLLELQKIMDVVKASMKQK